jgi:hypothetical protein
MQTLHGNVVSQLTDAERLNEIAEILALGLVRLRAGQSSELSRARGESSLDCVAAQSGHDNRLKSEEALR